MSQATGGPDAAARQDAQPAGGGGRGPSWLALVFPVFFGAGLFSLWHTHAGSGWLERIYRCIGIFTADSSWAFGGDARTGTLFQVLTIAAPLVTAIAAAELVTGFLFPLVFRRWAALRIALGGEGVAIFGGDARSLAFARAARGRYVPVIYAEAADAGLAAACRRARIALVADRPSQRVPLLVRRARHVVSFLPTANAQIDLAARLDAGSQAGFPTVWLFMADRGLSRRLDEYLKFAGHGRRDRPRLHPRLVHPPARAAADMLTRARFDVLADAFGQGQIHLAIYGCGGLGRAIVKHAAQLYVTRASLTNTRLRITIIDRDPGAALAALLAEDPGIDKVIDIAPPVQVEFATAGLAEAQVFTVLPADVTGHVIALGDPQAAFTLAVSMRRWLLEPPAGADEAFRLAHHAAPVFIRTPDRSGLGRLVRAPGDGGPALASLVPEGIFGFGALEAIMAPSAILDSEREKAARALHEAYGRARQRVRAAASDGQEDERAAEDGWDKLPPAFRDSNFQAAEHIPIKARAIGYRFEKKTAAAQDEGDLPPEGSEALAVLAELEHRRYVAERQTGGWRHADARCDAVRVHPDLVAWDELTAGEKDLDIEQIHALPAVARAIGYRFAKALFIGVTGHRSDPPGRMDEAHVRASLRHALGDARRRHAARAPVLLSALAPGADSWAADVAVSLGIPVIVPLPLPHELYSEDFSAAELADFHRLIARAEFFFELPLRAGRASDLTVSDRPLKVRNQAIRARQYALAGAYIAARAHIMLGVWDYAPSGGTGGTADVLSWAPDKVPPEYATPAHFFPAPDMHEKLIIPAHPGQGQDLGQAALGQALGEDRGRDQAA